MFGLLLGSNSLTRVDFEINGGGGGGGGNVGGLGGQLSLDGWVQPSTGGTRGDSTIFNNLLPNTFSFHGSSNTTNVGGSEQNGRINITMNGVLCTFDFTGSSISFTVR